MVPLYSYGCNNLQYLNEPSSHDVYAISRALTLKCVFIYLRSLTLYRSYSRFYLRIYHLYTGLRPLYNADLIRKFVFFRRCFFNYHTSMLVMDSGYHRRGLPSMSASPSILDSPTLARVERARLRHEFEEQNGNGNSSPMQYTLSSYCPVSHNYLPT